LASPLQIEFGHLLIRQRKAMCARSVDTYSPLGQALKPALADKSHYANASLFEYAAAARTSSELD
jgi:hypothetical protein